MSLATKTRNYLVFLSRCGRIAFVGDWRYYAWMGILSCFILLGINAYAKQFVNGLIVTGMSDQVSWGVYIANFTFIVGVAAAAAMVLRSSASSDQRAIASSRRFRSSAPATSSAIRVRLPTSPAPGACARGDPKSSAPRGGEPVRGRQLGPALPG